LQLGGPCLLRKREFLRGVDPGLLRRQLHFQVKHLGYQRRALRPLASAAAAAAAAAASRWPISDVRRQQAAVAAAASASPALTVGAASASRGGGGCCWRLPLGRGSEQRRHLQLQPLRLGGCALRVSARAAQLELQLRRRRRHAVLLRFQLVAPRLQLRHQALQVGHFLRAGSLPRARCVARVERGGGEPLPGRPLRAQPGLEHSFALRCGRRRCRRLAFGRGPCYAEVRLGRC
jgi:hypothetical protein